MDFILSKNILIKCISGFGNYFLTSVATSHSVLDLTAADKLEGAPLAILFLAAFILLVF